MGFSIGKTHHRSVSMGRGVLCARSDGASDRVRAQYCSPHDAMGEEP